MDEFFKKKTGWGIVHEMLLEDTRLSHQARLLGAWLAIRPDGWKFHKNQMKVVLALGEKNWDKAYRELTQAGYLVRKPKREKGRFTGHHYFFDPQPDQPVELRSTVGTQSAPGDTAPAVAEGAKGVRLTRTYKTKTLEQPPQPEAQPFLASAGVGGGEFQTLKFPKSLQASKKDVITVMSGLVFTQQQELLDELAGQLHKVSNHLAWLRSMANRLKAGEQLVFEHAPRMAPARQAERARELRERPPQRTSEEVAAAAARAVEAKEKAQALSRAWHAERSKV